MNSPDLHHRALQIALDVKRRRALGESVDDAEVIRQHSDLSPMIDQELRKLALLDQAKGRVADESSARRDAPDDGPRADVHDNHDDDFRFTVMVDDLDDVGTYYDSKLGTYDADSRKRINETKRFRPLARPATALLRIFHDDQVNYESRMLRQTRTVIGRVHGDVVIEHDRLVSSKHAEIVRSEKEGQWRWRLRDLESTNGTFVSIDNAKLKHGDELLMGSQRYRFVGGESEQPSLLHIVQGEVADRLRLSPSGTLIGRDRADAMEAFWDEYLDPKHAFIRIDANRQWRITNTRSVNGVWYRAREVTLRRSCFFQTGDQRFAFLC